MTPYKCYVCRHVFEATGEKTEYTDPIYGPCTKWSAKCPECGEEAGQFAEHPGKPGKSGSPPPCGNYSSCGCCGG